MNDNKKLFASMKQERRLFEEYWKEVAQHVEPRRGYFEETTYKDLGRRKDKDMINNRILQAKRVAVSGLYSGTVSSSRPWFKVESSIPTLMRNSNVRNYLFAVETEMRNILFESNFYPAAITAIDEFITFSTASIGHFDDDETVAYFTTPSIGSYYAIFDSRGRLSCYALVSDQIAQNIIERYGKENVSPRIKSAAERKDVRTKFKIVQLVKKNDSYNPRALDSKFKRFSSVVFEDGTPGDTYLEEKGFDEMPFYVMRWEVVANEAYGYGAPGMVALGDHKGLLEEEKEKAIAIKRMARPLLKGPPSLKNFKTPNQQGIVAYDDFGSNVDLEPIYQTDPRINELRQDMQAIEGRINEAFFVDLFQAISSLQGVQPRGEMEILQRNQESLTILGPVLERFQRDFMVQVLTRLYNQAFRAERFPEPPEELIGQPLDIRFVSTLAQAQRSGELSSIERYANIVGSFAGLKPEAADKIDIDMALDIYAQNLPMNPMIVPDNETVGASRQARAEAAAQQAALEQGQIEAQTNQQNATAMQQVTQALTQGTADGQQSN